MNPFEGLASYFLGRLEQKIVQGWIKLLFQFGFSALVTFLFVMGTLLAVGRAWETSLGAAMVAVAVVLTAMFRRSPLTRGMMIVLPAEEAAKEMQTNLQTISTAPDRKA